MRDEGFLLSIRARIAAIETEVEAARLDNRIRESNGSGDRLNFGYEWFLGKSEELNSIAQEIFRYS